MKYLVWVALTAVTVLGCAQPTKRSNETTIFRVYDLGDMYRGTMDDSKIRTFTAMIRDAVGSEEWLRANSTLHMLDKAIMIRTSPQGHESLSNFFLQFRSVTERS